MSSLQLYDVIVIGAGPAGCAAALAHAAGGGKRVLLLEANVNAANRLAGEWLHPGAVDTLVSLGIDLHTDSKFESGRGFAVFPEDGSEAIRLPYADHGVLAPPRGGTVDSFSPISSTRNIERRGSRGWSGEHRALVDRLRNAAIGKAGITFMEDARVLSIEGQTLRYRRKSEVGLQEVSGALIIGADGRTSRARDALGLPSDTTTVSRMAGIRLSGVELPFEGYGHVLLGGPGPILAYRIHADTVRLCIDVPGNFPTDSASLWDAYGRVLPATLRPAFRRELASGNIAWAANQVRPRSNYGRPGLCLIGDAVGFRHPLTAAGITLGIVDAATLAAEPDFTTWQRSRQRDTRVAEMLGSVLYEVFSEETETIVAMRKSVYGRWRNSPDECGRTMRYISGEPGLLWPFTRTFSRITAPALTKLMGTAVLAQDGKRAARVAGEVFTRGSWLVRGALGRNAPPKQASRTGGAAPAATPVPSAEYAIEVGVQKLLASQGGSTNQPGTREQQQAESGSWEGEVAWCPMLAAQYVIFSHVIGQEISSEQKARLLRHFQRTQFKSGLWGLHSLSEHYLFVTTLVYVASRMLGVDSNSDLLTRALDFIRREDILSIPSWGKFWLALAGLYDWSGVPPVVPELWALPTGLPIHPSNFYCHTRHIYLSMSVLYARKLTSPESRLQQQLRDELYEGEYTNIDWTEARRALRPAELVTPPSLPLRLAFEFAAIFERHHAKGFRRRVVKDLEERIRWELRATDHMSISPVSGTLNILALWASDPNDPEIKPAMEQLGSWIWEDDDLGMRIAGARSACWDTAFALQALTLAATARRPLPGSASPMIDDPDSIRSIRKGREHLWQQQISESPAGYAEAFRIDARGGWSFTNVRHAWPVSDCTAEAVEALLRLEGDTGPARPFREAVDFMLRCQNRDGGFGSYESQRSRVSLEWLNPAEMFGDSMTEHTYVECTGSCIAAITSAIKRYPELATSRNQVAVENAVQRLRALQKPDGSWQGVWAVQFTYGTLFGIRGLVAAGASPSDPALRRARDWILSRQRSDGGWGEAHEGCVDGEYIENSESQIIQTAWALMGLLEGEEPDWRPIERGAAFLMDHQSPDGGWPRQDPSGLFFRTALLDYGLYRQYFPVWALSLYESRRKVRLSLERNTEITTSMENSVSA